MFNVQLDLDEASLSDFEAIVKEHGFANIAEYLNAVVKSKILAAKVATHVWDDDGMDIRDSLEQSFYEALTGQTVPLAKLWEADEDDAE
jgi:hypothetical protein